MSARAPHQQPAIEAHGVLGDQRTAALVAHDGTVDLLCWPNLDSPSVFAALLDGEAGGSFALAPQLAEAARGQQRYRPDSNVLVTRFASEGGVAELTDFLAFPAGDHGPQLVRRVEVLRGDCTFRLRCAPAFDYARAQTEASLDSPGTVLFRPQGGDAPALRLVGPVEFRLVEGPTGQRAEAEFHLRAGHGADFILQEVRAPFPELGAAEKLCLSSELRWQAWVAQSTYRGRWREAVTRSALTLKLLTSDRYGSIAAAATFGLPEALGGARNWDYRATWIRDASFTVYAFMRLGYSDEGNAFIQWIEQRTGEGKADGSLQVLYGLDGRSRLDEKELPQLSGYRGSRPVRIGNGAVNQLQLDIYGELLDAVYLANKYGHSISHEGWGDVLRIVGYVCKNWQQPDQGIWELRAEARPNLHSRVMLWVAIDRAMRLAVKRSLPAPLADWHTARDAIHASVWQDFWNERRGHLVAVEKGEDVDAAMLLLPMMRFISATDPKWLATLDAIGRDLVESPLVYRYRVHDGLPGREGAFTACSFWYAECLARAGRLAEARRIFEGMLTFASPLGLFAEEIGPSGEQLGNTPQALTHLALISAAYYLDRELSTTRSATWRP